MNNLSPQKVAAIRLLGEEKELQHYFFSQLQGLDWFDTLSGMRYFNSENNPSPIPNEEDCSYAIPYWPVLDYLEKVSVECAKPENRQYADKLMNIIRDVTRPRDGKRVDNFRTWYSFAKVMENLPLDIIELEDVDLVGDWLDDRFSSSLVDGFIGEYLLPKFLNSPNQKDWDKAVRLVEVVTKIRWQEQKYGEIIRKQARTAIEGYWLREIFKINSGLLGERCGGAVVKKLVERIKEAVAKEDDAYSYIWRSAIEDHAQNVGNNESKNVLITGLRDVLLSYTKGDPIQSVDTIRGLFGEEYFVLKRIALYIVGEYYDQFKDLFWKYFSRDLFKIELQHELFNLLKNNFVRFDPSDQKRVVELISSLKGDWRGGADKELLDKSLRLEWLQAIQGQGNSEADRLYTEYQKVAQPHEHPEFPSYMESGFYGHVSPASASDILTMSISEIVKLLNEFQASGNWLNDPSEEGLADALKDAVKQMPGKFEEELDPFLQVQLQYQRAVINAFKELWKDRKWFDWQKVLNFCWAVVREDSFWTSEDSAEKRRSSPTPEWVASYISELIEEGVKSDEWAFDPVLLLAAKEIIIQILNKLPSSSDIGGGIDAFNDALNRPKGRAIIALLNYALRSTRLADKNRGGHEEEWRDIQPVFDRELEKCKGTNFEFSAIVGAHLPNFLYLSKEWLGENIERIFPSEHEQNFQSALIGYSYVNTVYTGVYQMLREKGIFERAIHSDFLDEIHRGNLISNIAVGYLRGTESLEGQGSLFAEVLRKWKVDDIIEIVDIFWMNRTDLTRQNIQHLVLDFWRWCFNRIRGQEEANKKVLSALNKLAVFLDDLSGDFKAWLMQSAPYVHELHHWDLLIDEFVRLVDKNAGEVADVLLAAISLSVPPHRVEKIISVVENIYQAGFKKEAKDICNKYGENNHPFQNLFNDLYKKYDP